MEGLSYDDQSTYRKYIKENLENYEGNYKAVVCNPVDYYNFQNPRHASEREVMQFDLDKVRHSDFIIVNFNAPKSLGTMAEIAIAYEHRIPVIGLNEQYSLIGQEKIFVKLHSWQHEMCTRIFNDMEEMLNHVKEFYLT